jgi:hypothetical protein
LMAQQPAPADADIPQEISEPPLDACHGARDDRGSSGVNGMRGGAFWESAAGPSPHAFG